MIKVDKINNCYIVSFYNVKRFNSVISGLVEYHLKKFLDTPNCSLVMNMKGIEFIDSAGFDTLLSVLDTADANNNSFKFSNVSRDVMELFELLELNDVFEISDN